MTNEELFGCSAESFFRKIPVQGGAGRTWELLDSMVGALQESRSQAVEDLHRHMVHLREFRRRILLSPEAVLPSSISLGNRIRHHRRKSGLSQRQLGVRIATTQTHISQVEVGHLIYPANDLLNGIAKELNVRMTVLLGFEQPQPLMADNAILALQQALYPIGLRESYNEPVARTLYVLGEFRKQYFALQQRRELLPPAAVIGKNIRRERLRQNMSLATLGQRCNRVGTAISDLERGTHEGLLPFYETTAQALQVTLPDLLGFTDRFPPFRDVSDEEIDSRQYQRTRGTTGRHGK